MSLEPTGFRVLIKPDPVDDTYGETGIIVHTESRKRMERAGQTYGTVEKIGPAAFKAFDDGTPWVEEGDRVIFAKYAGRFVSDPEDPDVEYIICNDEDIIGKIKGGK